jgi:hypothetical protein
MGDRGKFWGGIDESIRQMESYPGGPFDDVVRLSTVDGEEWVLAAVKDATRDYRLLETRLFKLEKIHEEVERLRARQDTKSRIISLDSEIRILSSKLNEFEDKKCIKQRLTTKKNTSSNLLKEERFRKQMQSKFTAKLDQLVALLRAWKASEKIGFDQNLLSDDVRMLLRNSDRNEFMHLRTVEYKSTSKRGSKSLCEGGSFSLPSKRVAMSTRTSNSSLSNEKSRSTRGFTEIRSGRIKEESDIRNIEDRKRPPRQAARIPKRALSPTRSDGSESSRQPKRSKTRSPLSPAQSPRAGQKSAPVAKKRLTLNPFSDVLQQALSSPKPSNKENPSI